MSDPVEIATLAIADYHRSSSPDARLWRDEARAVIAALEGAGARIVWREPTEEMCNSGALFTDGLVGAELTWERMIDAAPRYGGEGE